MIHIKSQDCIGCELCVRICPTDVLEMIDGRAVVSHLNQCIFCRLCENKCKFGLINIDGGSQLQLSSLPTIVTKVNPDIPQLTCLNIHVTQRCNQKCVHCFADSGESNIKELTVELAQKSLDEAFQLGLKSLTLTGGGEPLLRREFCYQISEYASSLGIPVRLCTNATLITKAVAYNLKKCGITLMQVSLDSSDPKIHDTFRGMSGGFSKAIQAIKLLRKSDIAVMARMTLTSQNYDQIDELLQLCIELDISSFRLAPLRPLGRGKKAKDWLPTAKQLQEAVTHLINCRNYFSEKISIATDECYAHLAFPAPNIKAPAQLGCRAGVDKIVIAPNGDILPCDTFPLSLGNIQTTSIIDVWQNHNVVKQLRTIDHITGKCGHCEYLNTCGGGCRAVAYAVHNDIYAEDPMCWHSCQ